MLFQPFNARRRSWKRGLSLVSLGAASFVFLDAFPYPLSPRVSAQEVAATSETSDFAPNLLTDRNLERTTYQQAGGYDARFDLKTDAVMVYGVSDEAIATLEKWRAESGSKVAVMTGVAWGNYADYLDGKFDGAKHWDDAQVRADGERIMHDPATPYLVPSVAFCDYLETRLKKVVDAGVETLFLEEPELWAFAGFSDSFKREWQMYYNESWIRPDSSCDAQYRSAKMMQYLYRRLLDRVCTSLKEYSLRTYNRPLKVCVATHSLLSYSQIRMVSPESALLDLPGIDGIVAQIWTGTSRHSNIYNGVQAERTFESAFLEYNVVQEMVRGTGKRVYYLNDPVEDNPRYDWNDYKTNYLSTLVASLMQSETHYYEVAPWPSRVFLGSFPAGSPDATTIPKDYASTLTLTFQQLRDMKQDDVAYDGATEGVGVLLADSAMFQRAEPTVRECAAPDDSDPTRPSTLEIATFGDFFGLATPLVKRGVPVGVPILDHALRYPGYLDKYKVLALSYEYQKPSSPGLHAVLADWVNRGGVLIYVGADTDAYRLAKDWWNTGALSYASPAEHLFESLGLGKTPKSGKYRFGKGWVYVDRVRPAYYNRSQNNADAYRSLVAEAVAATGGQYVERNYFLKRRGPYVLAATLTESLSEAPLKLSGRFVNLFDPKLQPLDGFELAPGERAWLLDLDKATAPTPAVLASSCRIESLKNADGVLTLETTATSGVDAISLLKLNAQPTSVSINGEPLADYRWDAASQTLFFVFTTTGKATIEIR